MVNISSVPNEYYLGDLPGTLQYSKEADEITETNLPDDDNTCGYTLCEHSLENLQRVTPQTQRHIRWKIILMMKMENELGETWLKAALLNKDTGKIALLTSTNHRNNIVRRGSRPVRTLDANWVVGHYRMSAPIAFWKELKNRLLY